MPTLEKISSILQLKYSEVLKRYSKEVETNKILFEKGIEEIQKGNQYKIISKNKPPVAGAISWARAIFYRIKRPIMKFLTKNDTVNSEEFNLRKEEYKSLAKQIDEYQKKRFTEWQENIM